MTDERDAEQAFKRLDVPHKQGHRWALSKATLKEVVGKAKVKNKGGGWQFSGS